MIGWEQVAAFLEVAREMLSPSRAGLAAILTQDGAFQMALTVAALAGLSEAAGESAVLFLNRVRFRRFALSLVISAVIFVFTYLFFALTIRLVARFAFGSEVDVLTVATVVGLSFAPRLYGFLVFLPYLGLPVSVLLNAWTVVVMTAGVAWTLEFGPLQALATILLGSVLLATLQRSIGRPLTALSRRMMRRAAGVRLVTDAEGLRALLDDGPEPGLRPAGSREPQSPTRARRRSA